MPSTKLQVSVIICTLNEAENLPHVLPRIPGWVDEVIIVDGRSTDGTIQLAERLCPRARILMQPGRGKGNALRYGISQASSEIVVTLDADGEMDPALIGAFVDALRAGYDFAKGSRLASGKPSRMSSFRYLGNRILTLAFNLLYSTKFTDVCSGYNAFWREAFLRIPLTYDGFHMDQQLLARAMKSGLRIIEVPHHSEGRIAGRSKTIGLKQGVIDLWVLVRERLCA
ncbi:MAG: glycosyltransferase family 2 protein [Armatimonadota bacterium]|nr:glycosyltransferase family 2 protein [Armatimonadota bacterium]MDR7559064.1 glycosyltransferase family 2 protein [Armatimonadota bacterium]